MFDDDHDDNGKVMKAQPHSKAWIYYTTAVVTIAGGILFAVLKYYEIRKARAEAAEAEARQRADKNAPPGPDGQPKADPKTDPKPKAQSKNLTLLPVKTEEDARKYWKLPSSSGDWQMVNGGFKMPGRVQRLATLIEVEGDCRIEFICGTGLSWKGPSIRVFGETVGLPAAIGGWPIRYSGTVTRKGTSLTLDVEVSQPGIKRLEDKKSEVTIKSEHAAKPSPVTFVWPDDMELTISDVKITGQMHFPEA